jgi:hypothetical protein
MATAINTIVCTRCHGSGSYSYNLRHGTVCYGCSGNGKMIVPPKGQKKIQPTCTSLHKAVVGDILEVSCILYTVEEIRWLPYTSKKTLLCEPPKHWNQQIKVTRLIDGKTYFFKRAASDENGLAIDTPQEWVGKVVVGKGIEE